MDPFDYFKNPTHPLSTFSREPDECYFCGTEGPGFEGPFYGENDDIEFVCEPCLRTGKLATEDATTCEGDTAALCSQLESRHPELSRSELEDLAVARTKTLEHATPGLHTWQDFMWPSHCGDYCQFIEELGKPEIAELAGQASPEDWFLARAAGASPDVWQAVRERSARKHPTESYDLTVYRFDCRECGEVLVHWDAS